MVPEQPFFCGQIVICGDPQAQDTKALLQCVHSIYIPNKVCAVSSTPPSPIGPPVAPSLAAWGEGALQGALPVPQRPQVTLSPLPLPQVLILADGDPSSFLSRQLPFLNTLRKLEDRATAYVCENQACSMPITEPSELRKLLHQ